MKKATYAVIGAIFILTAVALQRIDGGGGDTFALMALGIGMLFASANVTARRVRDGPLAR